MNPKNSKNQNPEDAAVEAEVAEPETPAVEEPEAPEAADSQTTEETPDENPEPQPPAAADPAVDAAATAALEAAQLRIAELEREAADARIAAAVTASDVAAREPLAVAALIDRTRAIDEAGVAAEVARLKSTFPGLFYGPGSADGAALGGAAIDAGIGFDRVRNVYATTR